MSDFAEIYSSAKYGSMKDIKFLAQLIVKTFIESVNTPQSQLNTVLCQAAQDDSSHVVLMTPGYRNVKASVNLIFDIALPVINSYLSIKKLPLIANIVLPRLVSPAENYASLSEKERKLASLRTDHVLPEGHFYKGKNIHVIYGDDIFITMS